MLMHTFSKQMGLVRVWRALQGYDWACSSGQYRGEL